MNPANSASGSGGSGDGQQQGPIYTSGDSSTIPVFINKIIAEANESNGRVSVVHESEIPNIILPDMQHNGLQTAPEAPKESPPVVVADSNEDSSVYCWVCFADSNDDVHAAWVKPCRCRGTTKWVHQACIQRWIDEKQKGNTAAKVLCPQCNTEYFIFYPPQGSLVVIMDSLDAVISRVCPFVAAGIVVGSIYWTAVTYGAITCMQIVGHKEGLTLMERADPLFLLFGLPCIPVMLILGKMIRWEDSMLKFIRKHSWKIPLFRNILPSINPPTAIERLSQELPPLSDPVSATRILCGALLFPSIASMFGKVLFENVKSNFRRALLGGVAFVAIKGVLRIYHMQQQHVRQSRRKIMDFNEERVRASEMSRSDPASPRPRF